MRPTRHAATKSFLVNKDDKCAVCGKTFYYEKKEVTDRPAVNFYEMNKKIKLAPPQDGANFYVMNKKIKLVRLVTKATKKSSTPKGSENF